MYIYIRYMFKYMQVIIISYVIVKWYVYIDKIIIQYFFTHKINKNPYNIFKNKKFYKREIRFMQWLY